MISITFLFTPILLLPLELIGKFVSDVDVGDDDDEDGANDDDDDAELLLELAELLATPPLPMKVLSLLKLFVLSSLDLDVSLCAASTPITRRKEKMFHFHIV